MPQDQAAAHKTLPPHILRVLTGESEADGQAIIELHEHIKRVHRRLNGATDPPLSNLTRACIMLAETLLRGRIEPTSSLEAIRLNLEYIGGIVDQTSNQDDLKQHFGRVLQAARCGSSRFSDKTQETMGLKLVNHKRLGEILLTLCAVSDEDLMLALRMQKVTGKRIGDTMVEMGLVTQDQLDSALRMQDRAD